MVGGAVSHRRRQEISSAAPRTRLRFAPSEPPSRGPRVPRESHAAGACLMAAARGGRAFPLLETKLRPATGRAGIIDRARVVKPLVRTGGPPAVAPFPPPGYGKTNVLGPWAAPEARPAAGVTGDGLDNEHAPVR